MLSTDRFVYVHEPKTGGTFVTSAVLRLHGVRWTPYMRLATALRREVVRRGPRGTLHYFSNKHGTCTQVPAAHRHKPVLATVRNPYDLYVSEYEFGWWRRPQYARRFAALPDFARRYPTFPELDFASYVALVDEAFREPGESLLLGMWSRRFVRYYFRDPAPVLAAADEAFVSSPDHRASMFDVHFARTHRLNDDLYDFLVRVGYDPADADFVRGMRKVLPGGKGRDERQRWERYYSPELKRAVRDRERMLFTIFPEFDV